jgi:hypothetical protein
VTDERETMLRVAGADDSWLGNYVLYARRLTDAPIAFHVAGGLAAMAGAIGSNIFWRGGGHREQWPNLYVLLLAPSGVFRKSTSVDLPTYPLANAVPGIILDREFSPEQFIRNLADHPTSVLKESEFGSLLERMKSSYMQGMKQRLTDLFDCQDSYDRVIRGATGGGERIRIIRPALTILAASTLDWLVESLTETDMRSGFMPRFLFIAPTIKESEPPGGYWAEGDPKMLAYITKALAQMATMKRTEVSFKKVRRRIVEWTTDQSEVAESGTAADELMGLYSRLGHHLAKLCVLLTVSDEGILPAYEITEDAAERAIAMLEWILEGTARVFDERVTFSKFEQQAQKALRFIGGQTERGVLLKRMKCAANELDRLLVTLKERGEIREETEQTGGRPRKLIVRTLPEGGGEERGRNGAVSGEVSPNGRIVSFSPLASLGK